ncbi:MAG: cupredoxin domain-containing protein [Candidatus Limnocylindrales bacterium]
MHPQPKLIRFALPLGMALILSACGGAGPGWTYAPLGPTAAPTAAASASPAPSGSGGPGITIQVKTTEAAPLVFEPAMIEAPANTSITVTYTNDSSAAGPHNINFFNGPDSSADSLGKTEIKLGPGNVQSVTFTTSATPGDYYFWCDVHMASMSGMLHVTP